MWSKNSFVRITTLICISIFNLLAQNPYLTWTKSASMVINTTPQGADIAQGQSVTNFPLLVNLEGGYFDFSAAKTDGGDIRFATATGTPLKFHFQSWDATAKQAAVWVLIPTVQGNQQQSINVYWGNSAATSESNSAAVFGTTNGFYGVWHLEEDPSSNGNNSIIDASGRDNHGTPEGSPLSVKGPSGKGVFIDGANDKITMTGINWPAPGGNISVSFWTFITTEGIQNSSVFNIGQNAGQRLEAAPWRGNGNIFWDYGNCCGDGRLNTSYTPYLDQWNHVTVVSSGSNNSFAAIYINGEQKASKNVSLGNTANINTLTLGELRNNPFQGSIDEFRISNVIRNPAWVKLSYENQRLGQTLVSLPVEVGCVEQFGVASPTLDVNEGDIAALPGIAKCAQRVGWYRMDGNTEIFEYSDGFTYNWPTFRVAGDTKITFRFKALMSNGWQSADLEVTVKETVPDPQFTYNPPPPAGNTWNGVDPIPFFPSVSNLAQIQSLAPPNNTINYDIKVTGARAYKQYKHDGIILTRAYENGTINVDICLDNGGVPICINKSLNVTLPNLPPAPPIQAASGKLKIFVMAGQSNMEGYGQVEGVNNPGSLDFLLADQQYAPDYQHLVDNSNQPLVFNDVWVYYPKEDIGDYTLKSLEKGPLSPRYGIANPTNPTIGPEYAMGYHLGQFYQDQVLLIKTAWGGHSLGEKFRPPGSGGVLGPSYVHMLEIVDEVTTNLKTHFPTYDDAGYEIVGLGWHQGYNDQFCENCKAEYAENLATLIDDLRVEWNNPRLPVSIGESGMLCGNDPDDICDSQKLVPSFAGFDGNVAYTANRQFHQANLGPGPGYHWYGSFYSYYNVGDLMGKAMVNMLNQSVPVDNRIKSDGFNWTAKVLKDQINIFLSISGEYEISIHNLRGQSKVIKINNHRVGISRQGLNKGVYLLEIKGENIRASKKLILQ